MKRPAAIALKRPASSALQAASSALKRPAVNHRFVPHPATRIVAIGSGADGMGERIFADAIVALSGKERPRVLYLGTPTYDLQTPKSAQTCRFKEMGCVVDTLLTADATPSVAEIDEAFSAAQVIVMSGGNTLFAIDRLTRLGVHSRLRQAMERGVVLAGGSAGAICWFDAGHSDSMDPETYKKVKLAAGDCAGDHTGFAPDGEKKKDWKYVRCPGFGFLPGLCCPHHDKTQSNGVLRAHDLDSMLQRHPGEVAICIDHWAGLVIEGDSYRVICAEGKEGSVLSDDPYFSETRQGRPGIWRKSAFTRTGTPVAASGVQKFAPAFTRSANIYTELVPDTGKVANLLVPAFELKEDPLLHRARSENQDDVP